MLSSAGVIAVGKGADVGAGRKTGRKRAVGTRENIIAYLSGVDELFDANGMASTQLAAAVGYPGSSVAFAQLLSGMERSGLIGREVRGKRTYRIRLGPAHAAGLAGGVRRVPSGAAAPGAARASGAGVAGGGAGDAGDFEEAGFDYDELARRLLVQVVRQLAAADHGKLAEENDRLRVQLRAAQRSLALAAEQVRRLPASTGLDHSEVVLLQRLLTSGDADNPDDSGQQGLAEAPSLLG